MQKLSYKKPLLFSLITALLLLQWSSTHIHLAGEHEHHGDQHQHSVTAHQHQLASQHENVIDSADDTLSHIDNNKVVELEYVCTQCQGNLSHLFAVIPTTAWKSFEQQTLLKQSLTTYKPETYQSYNQYTSIRLRAPPVIS